MAYVKLLALLGSFLVVLICHTSAFAQMTVTYPLHAGDRWEYLLDVNSRVYTVKDLGDTLMAGGSTYAYLDDGIYSYYAYQRQSGNRVYWLTPCLTQEQLRYDFGLSVGDTVASIVDPADTLDIIFTSRDTVYIFGRDRRQWSFSFRFRHIVDGDEFHIITDSIGLTYLGQTFGAFTLRGAVLNGVTYGTVTTVNDQLQSSPVQFELCQNYPNPFNPSTSISFSIFQHAHVRLLVFNVLGQLIESLVDEDKQPGNYSVLWNANDVASGLYLYRILAEGLIQTKKAVLIR
jgi:hypothetical protein